MKLPRVNIPMTRARKYLILGVLAVITVATASFADRQQREARCSRIVINIADSMQHQFISSRNVMAAIAARGNDDIMYRDLGHVDLRYIEDRVTQNSFVKDAQAYFDMDGGLHIDLHQRVPLIRVLSPMGEAYYLDDEGKRMPLSSDYTALVPVVTAEYSGKPMKHDSVFRAMDSSLHLLAKYLLEDNFAQSLSGQFIINTSNELRMVPRLGNFTIELGDVSDLGDKFTRLKSFYRTKLPQFGWGAYQTVSVKYKNQIIANR